MKRQTKFTSEDQQQRAVEQQSQTQPGREFANAEEMLRYDAAQTTVPPVIAERLQKSIGPAPAPNRSWWRRLFGGSNA